MLRNSATWLLLPLLAALLAGCPDKGEEQAQTGAQAEPQAERQTADTPDIQVTPEARYPGISD